jgi:hypothetical protein
LTSKERVIYVLGAYWSSPNFVFLVNILNSEYQSIIGGIWLSFLTLLVLV